MATALRSAAAAVVDAGNSSQVSEELQENKHARQRSNSGSSSGSSELISYADQEDVRAEQPIKTTRQKVDRRPPSTFHKKKRTEMTLAENLCHIATCPDVMHELKDESLDRGPMPTRSLVRENIFIITRGVAPLLIQQAAYHYYPDSKWPFYVAYPFYLLSFIGFAIAVLGRLNRACVEYGTFDEKQIGRDRTPDKAVNHLAAGILAYMFVRTGIAFFLYYDKEVAPLSQFTWSYPFRLMAWEIVFDYFFYVYHRTTHEVDSLWFVHQHHHTTKHPTAILSILAETYQEYLEVLLVPLAATLIVKQSFAEQYLTFCYTIYVEMMGHSGVRCYWPHPVLSGLKFFDMELAVEDHDLHHRYGKSGRNYGKQTRVWDKIFGTVGERIETLGM
ncbi:BQ2448_7258 [Microbotryum intermedium]|uniref:BQ2448_7258 protein n=1 Tax=Microbotryum intermedium TaxID=269621 RepID=A0A238FHQ3_9BASI|nr:BQ2448_7258 [Microbotryum intermedium]